MNPTNMTGYTQLDQTLNCDKDILYLNLPYGGKQNGGLFYDKTYEKDYVLKFGTHIYNLLKPYFKKIYMSRYGDNTVTLETRIKRILSLHDKYDSVQVISFHCDTYNPVLYGATIELSSNVNKEDSNYIFANSLLKDYCNTFYLYNKGVGQTPLTYTYWIPEDTELDSYNNVVVYRFNLFHGDNRIDCKKGKTDHFIKEATFFIASYILKRYGVSLKQLTPNPNSSYSIQLGKFDSREEAALFKNKLKLYGFDSVIVKQ